MNDEFFRQFFFFLSFFSPFALTTGLLWIDVAVKVWQGRQTRCLYKYAMTDDDTTTCAARASKLRKRDICICSRMCWRLARSPQHNDEAILLTSLTRLIRD